MHAGKGLGDGRLRLLACFAEDSLAVDEGLSVFYSIRATVRNI